MDERHGGLSRARVKALRRAGRVKRWLVGGAVAIAGLFSAAVSNAMPVDDPPGSDAVPVKPALGRGAEIQATLIGPPAAPPRASTATRGAVSGGS
jgi:hypothetical protein